MKVGVLGTGMTHFGELWDKDALGLAREAGEEALAEAMITKNDIDVLVVGNMLLNRLEGQAHVGAAVAQELDYLGQTMTVEAACASGGMAIRTGLALIESKMAQKVLVIGFEKMTDVPTEVISRALMGAGGVDEQWAGATFPALYGLIHSAYASWSGVGEEELAEIAVKNHYHGSLNALAHFNKQISRDEVLNSAPVALPIRQLHCSPISDGAAAVVLGKGKSRVEIVGSGHGGDVISLAGRNNLTSFPATQRAMKEAIKEAGISPKDLGVMELHDCFSVAEAMAIEDLGLTPAGTGARQIAHGYGRLGESKILINPSGGLKACGHPVGATGVKQIVEISRQLLGMAGKRQGKPTDYGLTHNVGGTGATAVVHILRRNNGN